ncbi:fused (3R)-hydroxyacyl-ACP dehydratase subunits HadA/HadB [Nocardia sp. IFM 10818]
MVALGNAPRDDVLEPPTAAVPGTDERLRELRSMVGRSYRLREDYEVGREQVRAFARAVQNDHPAHVSESAAADLGYRGLLAPPTFAALLAGAAQEALAGLLTGCDLTTAVQTQQVMDFYRPMMVGDRLTSTVSLQSHREAFGGDLLAVTNTITDRDGEVVLIGNTSIIARTGAAELGLRLAELNAGVLRHDVLAIAPPAVDEVPTNTKTPAVQQFRMRGRSRDRVAVGDQLPVRSYRLTLGDLVHYAGVAGDPNPIHWFEPTGALVGLGPGVVAHGMLTMGLGAGYLTSWAQDPRAMRQYSVRITGPVYVVPGTASTIEFGGKVIALHRKSGTATVAITATQDGRRIFGRATAVIALS